MSELQRWIGEQKNENDGTALDSWLSKQKTSQGKRVSAGLMLDERDPDAVAEARTVGRDLGLPAAVVEANPEESKAQASQKKDAEVLQRNTALANWLSESSDAPLAKDDIETIDRLANTQVGPSAAKGSQFTKGVKTGVTSVKQVGTAFATIPVAGMAQTGLNRLEMFEKLESQSQDLERHQVAELLGLDAQSMDASIAFDFLQGDEAHRQRHIERSTRLVASNQETMDFLVAKVREYSDQMQETQGRVPNFTDIGDLQGFGDWFAFNTGQAIPYLGALAVSGLAGGAPAVVGAGYVGGVGDIQAGLIEEGVTDQGGIALAGGIPYAGLELIGPAAAPFRRVTSETLQSVARGYFQRLGRNVPEQFVEEFINEAGQEVIKDLAVAAGTGEELEFNDEALLRWFNSGMAGGASGAAMSSVVTAAQQRTERQLRASDESSGAPETLAEIDKVASESKLKQRSPEAFEQAVAAAGIDNGSIYVQVDDLLTFFQARDLTIDEGAKAYGLNRDDLETQAATGGAVSIPPSVYAARISGTSDADWFHQNATLDPDTLTASEAQRFNERVQDVFREEFEAMEADHQLQQAYRSAEQVFHDGVYSQLREAGRTPDVAQNEARLWSSFFATMVSRTGLDPQALAERLAVVIQGPQRAARRRGAIDIALNTLRSGKRPQEAPTLAEFVLGEGGVQDRGGDVAELDLPAGVISETAQQISDRESQPTFDGMPDVGLGIGLDEMARKAREAGYLQTEDTNDLLSALADEASGRPVFALGQEPDGFLDQLEHELGQRGLDLSLSNDELATALEGVTFQQGEQASISFPENGPAVIRLFESADLSSFLHESGHFFLEAMNGLGALEGVPQDVKDDLETIRDFLGAKEGQPFTTEQHEKWARAFETYAMEGKAPSLALLDAFSRFKAWLTRIYRTVANLDVDVSPEIRQVMDRMLATENQIQEARAAQELSPLFSDAKAAGMDASAFTTYQKIARRSVEEANRDLLEKNLEAVRRKTETWWRTERKSILEQVTSAVNSRPEFRLVEAMANGRWLGDDARNVPDMQLDRAELVGVFGPGVLAELNRSRLGGRRGIYKEGGMPLGEAAEIFGFANSVQMVEALQNAGKRQHAINAEADRIMLDRYGDPMTDGSIEQEALRAVHSKNQAELTATELRHLTQQAGGDPRTQTTRIFKARAKAMIGKMSVQQAARPEVFLAAERRAARDAERAFAKVVSGKTKGIALREAADAKERQLLSQYLYREARDIADLVASKREKMRNYSKPSIRKKLEGGYIEQIDGLLSRFDFRKRGTKQVRNTERLGEFVDRMIADGREAELAIDARLISDTRRRHYTRMTVDEIRGLFDTIANLDHMGRFKQSLIEKGRKRELDRSAGIVRDAIVQNLGAGKVDKQSGFIRNTFNVAFTADTMLAAIDGQEFGPVYEEIKSSIDKGQVEEQRMGVELAEKLEEVFSVYSAKERADMQKPRLVPGVSGYEWSKAEILSAALNTGNADNLDRLLDKNAAQPRRLTRPQLDALLDTLDKRDWDFVQSMWDTIDSYWPQLAEVEKRRTGVVPQKVEPVPVSTKFGTYGGGYYPISYDPTLSINAANDERTAWDRFTTAGHGAKAAVKNGMTISRVKNANGRTLKFDLGVPIRSMRDTIRLITLSEAIDNAHRILNHPQVAAAFFEAGRKNDLETLNLWLQDTARGPVFNTDALNTVARMVKNNFTLSRLAFNVKTAALQFTGVSQSAVVIGKRNMARGYMDYLKRPRELTAEIIEKSPFMAERKSTFQRDIRDFLMDEQISSPLAGWWSNAKSVIGKAGFAPIVVTQFYAVDLPTWLGAYRSGLEQFGADEAKAIHYADRMVARAQGSGLIGDRSNIERGTLGTNTRQSDFVRLFTTLQGYMLTKMNRGYLVKDRFQREFRDAETLTGKMSAAATAATNLTLLYVTEGALMGLLHMVVEDEAEWDDYLAFVGSEAFGSLLSGLPFGSNISAASRGFGGGGVLGSTLELPFQLYNQAQQGENDPALRKAVGETIGLATGLPSTATMRALESAMDDEKGLSDALFGHNPLTD